MSMFRQELLEIRKSLGVTQVYMAERLGTTKQTLCLMETGKREVKRMHILAARAVAMEIAAERNDPQALTDAAQFQVISLAMNMPEPAPQPLVMDEGVPRFRANSIVRYLLDAGPFNMNHLAVTPFEDEDRRQFAQLIGYPVWGYGELSYVLRDEQRLEVIQAIAADLASRQAQQQLETVNT